MEPDFLEDVNNGITDKLVSLNLRAFSNLRITYSNIMNVDRSEVISDIKFWNGILDEVATGQTTVKPVATQQVSNVPDNVEVLQECPKCEGTNLTFKTGTNQKTGKVWYAFDCGDCKTPSKFDGKEYPTRTFVDACEPKSKFDDSDIDDFDSPF